LTLFRQTSRSTGDMKPLPSLRHQGRQPRHWLGVDDLSEWSMVANCWSC